MENIFKNRYDKLMKNLEKNACDGLILNMSPNMYYITGYSPKVDERFQVLFISATHTPVLVVPSLYLEEAEKNCWVEERIVVNDGDCIDTITRDLLEKMGLLDKKIAIDNNMPMHIAEHIIKNYPNEKIVMADNIFNELRIIKDSYEIEILKESGRISDEVMGLAFNYCREGLSEIEIRDYLEQEYKKRDLRGAYSNLIASGANTSLPHHTTSNRLIKNGDVVYFDIGGTYKKYWSDITRTLYVGKPNDEFCDTYKRVQEAQEKAKAKIKPGVLSEEVFETAYRELEKSGLGKYFIHRLGHGMGLQGHENININRGDKTVLQEGMVFSIEPGVYFKDKYGIRIEDCVVVTKDGHMTFNNFNRDLIIK